MIIDCISDLHGFFPVLDGGDLLIIAGDMTATNHLKEWIKFYEWFHAQKYRKKIYIAGNHDNFLGSCASNKEIEDFGLGEIEDCDLIYLRDSGIEFEGLKIWGAPWTNWFERVNPHCSAFMLKEEELKKKWDLIPHDIDILVTHGPNLGVLDACKDFSYPYNLIRAGSETLSQAIIDRPSIKLHVFGHIHEQYGIIGPSKIQSEMRTFVNCSIVNERYEHVNLPIRIIYV
jgi:hypothetical protein